MDDVAAACAAAARQVLGGPARLVVPRQPVPVAAGDAAATAPLLRFPLLGGEAVLYVPEGAAPGCDPAMVAELGAQLQRVWQVQEELAGRALEADRLRFNVAALQQVARTLAVVRRTEETERIVLDSIGEVFFAWWAALYLRSEAGYALRAARTLRGEALPPLLPARAIEALGTQGQAPAVPPVDAELRRHVGPEIAIVEALNLGDGNGAVLMLGPRMTGAAYEAHDLALLRALADSSAVALRNARLLDRLHTQATVDELTGCRNRRGFDELLATEISRAKRHGRPLSLLLIDIDHFKSVNDELGHAAGDHALSRIGQLLQSAFRVSDSACRYGGEEFAVILPETAKPEAGAVGERVRRLIADLEPDDRLPRRLTASLGVASCPDDAGDAAALVQAADAALYGAKAAGRNLVRVA